MGNALKTAPLNTEWGGCGSWTKVPWVLGNYYDSYSDFLAAWSGDSYFEQWYAYFCFLMAGFIGLFMYNSYP